MTPSLLALLTIATGLTWTGDPCDPIARAELERLLAIELRSAAPSVQVVLRITSCEDGVAGLLALIDLGPDRAPERVSLDLANVEPSARMRTASLAIGETIRARQKDPPRAPLHTETTVPETPARASYASVRVAFATRALAEHGAWAPGIVAGGSYPLTSWLRLSADAGWQRAATSHGLGEVRLDLAHVNGSLQYTRELGPFIVAVGPSVEGGLAWAAGTSERSTVGTARERGLFVRIALRADLAIPLTDTFAVAATAEGGTALRGLVARVDDTPALGIDGFSATLAVGLAYSL